MNVLIAMIAALVIWCVLFAAVCALVGFEQAELDDDARIDSIRAELDRQEQRPRKVRAGT